MKKIGGISKRILSAIYDWLSSVVRYPMETIEFVVSLVVVILAINTIIPAPSIVYGNEIAKALFGALLLYPSVPIVYWRIRLKIQEYVFLKVRERRVRLFLLSIATTYLMTLSIVVQSVWPPHWILYFGLAAVAWISYLRIGK